MYVSIRRYKVQPNSMDQILKQVKEGFTPLVKKAPGFQAYYALKQGNDTLATVSVFGTKEGAEQSNRLAAEFIRNNNLSSLLPNPPEITAGETEVHETVSSGMRTGF